MPAAPSTWATSTSIASAREPWSARIHLAASICREPIRKQVVLTISTSSRRPSQSQKSCDRSEGRMNPARDLLTDLYQLHRRVADSAPCLRQYFVMDREERQFQPVGNTGFVIDAAQVVLNHLL